MKDPTLLTVISANVNGIRAAQRRGGVKWLSAGAPHIICMQEVRASDDQLVAALADSPLADLHVAHAPSDKAGRAGVAVLSAREPLDVRVGLGEFETDGRWIEADFRDGDSMLTVVSAYTHTGEADTPKQDEKYRFMDAMHVRMDQLAGRAAHGTGEALITGDLNVAHREVDIKNWKGNRGRAGFLEGERAYFDRWLGDGEQEGTWVDLGRKHGGPGPGPYTWWTWRGQAFDNDTGWRIDYQLATRGLAARSVDAQVGRAASYAERWSDHAPLTVTYSA